MKTLVLTLILSLTSFLNGISQNTVEAGITHLDNGKGKAEVGLYNSEEEFIKILFLKNAEGGMEE